MNNKTTPFFLLLAATLQVSIGLWPSNAKPEKSGYIPMTINVEKVSITDEDVDQAIKLCLAKEGNTNKGVASSEKPSPAQSIVMAEICGQQQKGY